MSSRTSTMPPRVFEPAYYDRLADIERRHWWALGLRATATRLLDGARLPSRQLRVLDAGCGTGLTLSWLARYTDRSPIGLDYSAHALRYCADAGQRLLVEGSAVSLPVAGASVDLVVSADVIQHLPRPGGDQLAFAEVVRVLRPGGRFLLRTNSRCGQPIESTADYHRYSLHEIRSQLHAAGMEPEVVAYANCIPGLLTTLKRWLTSAGRGDGDPGLWIVAQPPESGLVPRIMYWTMLAEAWWVGTLRLPLPFGHTIVALARKPQ